MQAASWEPGDVVVWREAWRGRPHIGAPVRVVADDERALLVYLAEGTRYGFPPGRWPWSERHPWAEPGFWTGHGVLILYPPGRAHAIWHFWRGEERRFAGWYVNLQDPLERDGMCLDSHDHELDLVIRPDGSWYWKDEDKMDDWVRRGRYTPEEVAAARAEGERVLAEWPFPTGWEDWEPDPSRPVPELPDGWED
jgi:hypothetical protein